MFDSMKELFNARDKLSSTQEQIEQAERRLQELTEQLADAEMELEAREDTISKRDDIIIAVNRQVTEERQAVLDAYAQKEHAAEAKLADMETKLQQARTHFEDCERQVYCMANLYKAMRGAITRYSVSAVPDDLEVTPEEMEEIRLTEESVGLKMHSYKLEDLRKMHEANNKLIEQLIARYGERLKHLPVDCVVFQLMTLGIRAELQQIVNDLEYGEIGRAQVKLHLTVGKYLKILSYANLTASSELEAFASELEILLKEILQIENAYCERRTDFERHQKIFGKPEDTESEPEAK